MVFYLKAADFSVEAREKARARVKPDRRPPATLNDFSPEDWAIVKMVQDACQASGGITASGQSQLAAFCRESAEFAARSSTGAHRSSGSKT